jgi:hypothetical protein
VFLLFVVPWPENCKIVITALENATSLSVITEPIFNFLEPYGLGLAEETKEWKADIAADGVKGN